MYEDIDHQQENNAYVEQQDQVESMDNTDEIEFKQLNYDQALSQVGSSGYYQKRTFVIFGLQWMITTWILFAPVFYFIQPTIDCKNDINCINECSTLILDEKCLSYICINQELSFLLVIHQIQHLILYCLANRHYNQQLNRLFILAHQQDSLSFHLQLIIMEENWH
ncbi:unnamed protein product [Paramecium sonneborni]|uniref:Transmembrane protein n=1 Tax=Paramecium sonneborni TaxID=65129 RepID=A0A8S1PN54_9CILI|nr:unnamed protein product [Paramecium sonneborni]